MRRSHQAMFNRAFDQLYLEYCNAGVPPHIAREHAADEAWTQYEQYCDEKLEEIKTGDRCSPFWGD
jgi:hypothetical protein